METPTCKCCLNQTTQFVGHIDFNKTCMDRFGSRIFPVSDVQVPYYSCQNCGFVFTDMMDTWSKQQFSENIYNTDYSKADAPTPGYENKSVRESISYQNGINLIKSLDGSEKEIRVLDYGAGGNPGKTGLAFLDHGFELFSYEPHLSDTNSLPEGIFEFIYAIEVVEHCHDLEDLGTQICQKLSLDGIFYVQTLLHPFPTPDNVLNSWYISPRNGHISIFTFQSLVILFRRYGINIVQTIHGVIGFTNKPIFKNNFLI